MKFFRRLRFFFRRDRASAELEEEMRLHQELRAASLARSGVAPADATNSAHQRFGNSTRLQQESRDAWGFAALDELRQDLRYAVRRLRQRPAFTLSIVTVLALGIGATTAIFSAVDAAMLRPLPFLRVNELVALRNIAFPYDLRFALGGAPRAAAPHPHDVRFPEVATMHEIFSHVAGYAAGGLNLGDPAHPLRVHAGVVTADFFATMAVVPIRGRGFVPEEGVPDGLLSVVISYALWHSEYGGRDIVGRNIRLGDRSYAVVGIAPKDFSFPQHSDLWIPLVVPVSGNNSEALGRASPSDVIARLASGISIEDASRRLLLRWQQDASEGLAPGQKSTVADDVDDVRRLGTMIPLQRSLLGDHRRALVFLLGATGMLLLIACANVSHLLLSQAASRRREVAVREVLGATRARVIRQLLVESLLLSLSGALIGTALAPALAGLLDHLIPPEVAGIMPIRIDLRVLGFAAGLALATGIGLGLWPAFSVTRRAPAETIKTGGVRGATAAVRHARGVLVATELALTVTLLICGALMLRSFYDLMARDVGMQTEHVGTLEMAFPLATIKPLSRAVTSTDQLPRDMWGLERQRRRVDEMIERLHDTPGIVAAAAIDNLPLSGEEGQGLASQLVATGAPALAPGSFRSARTANITADYFRVMGIPVLRGRPFSAADDSLAPHVAIINRTMAAQYWPGLDPIGRQFGFGAWDSNKITVVGVVGDIRDERLDHDPTPQAYFPTHQSSPYFIVSLVARGTLAPGPLLLAMQNAVHAVNPVQPVYNVYMMNDVIDLSIATRRTNTILLSLFAALALVLAVLGVYSVVSHGVTQCARELGIRAALGGTSHDLLALIARETMWSTTIGVIAGLAGAWVLSHLLASFLFGISAHDPATFVMVPLILLLATAMATLIPALRVLRINPAEVMRAE